MKEDETDVPQFSFAIERSSKVNIIYDISVYLFVERNTKETECPPKFNSKKPTTSLTRSILYTASSIGTEIGKHPKIVFFVVVQIIILFIYLFIPLVGQVLKVSTLKKIQ